MKMRLLLACVCLALAASACEGMGIGNKPSKMASGQLYESGDSKYDAYFKKVHDEQIAAGDWAEQSKHARKPITTALNLPPTASNSAIIDAAKSKKADNALHSAAEETAALERTFIDKQKLNAERLDKLANEGVDLKKQATEDRRNMGADKADPAKVDKKEEIKNEVAAAAEIAAHLRDDAKHGAFEGEKLIDALKHDLGVVGDGAGIPKKDDDKGDGKKDEKKGDGKKSDGKKGDKKDDEKKPSSKKPESKPSEKPAEKPSEEKPAKKPAEKPSEGEVFNP